MPPSAAADLESAIAHLSCRCGKVEISLPFKSILRYECCCCDCRKGLAFFHTSKGGPTPPTIPDIVYYPNLLMVMSGRSLLRCFTIAKQFPSRRIYASCCWTPLLADNPAYQAKRIAVFNGPARLKVNGTFVAGRSPLHPPDDRIRTGDMTPAELGALPSFTPPTTPRTWVGATAAAERALAEMKDASGAWKPTWRMWDLVTVQQLIESLPTGVEVADPSHDGPTPYWIKHGFAPHHLAAPAPAEAFSSAAPPKTTAAVANQAHAYPFDASYHY